MKNNYPIKYALIPVYDQIEYVQGIEECYDEYEPVYYIVSKCYLINEVKKYKQDGTMVKKYSVVFPYTYMEFNEWVRQEPERSLYSDSYLNAVEVDKIYDNLEDAHEEKFNITKEIIYKKYYDNAFDKVKRDKLVLAFKNDADYYDSLEYAIKEKTKNLENNKDAKKQSVIIFKDNSFRIVISSLYTIMNLYQNSNFIVCSLSNEDYLELRNHINNIDDMDIIYCDPILAHDSKSNVSKIKLSNFEAKYLYNNIIYDECKNDFEVPKDFDLIIYSIEDVDDLIKSFVSDKETMIRLSKRKD